MKYTRWKQGNRHSPELPNVLFCHHCAVDSTYVFDPTHCPNCKGTGTEPVALSELYEDERG